MGAKYAFAAVYFSSVLKASKGAWQLSVRVFI